ncbi:MAG: hypothetical protein KC503_06795 [Myxococcales bacterium]|nr:hypothetical protein [Myxococcales bacterium]
MTPKEIEALRQKLTSADLDIVSKGEAIFRVGYNCFYQLEGELVALLEDDDVCGQAADVLLIEWRRAEHVATCLAALTSERYALLQSLLDYCLATGDQAERIVPALADCHLRRTLMPAKLRLLLEVGFDPGLTDGLVDVDPALLEPLASKHGESARRRARALVDAVQAYGVETHRKFGPKTLEALRDPTLSELTIETLINRVTREDLAAAPVLLELLEHRSERVREIAFRQLVVILGRCEHLDKALALLEDASETTLRHGVCTVLVYAFQDAADKCLHGERPIDQLPVDAEPLLRKLASMAVDKRDDLAAGAAYGALVHALRADVPEDSIGFSELALTVIARGIENAELPIDWALVAQYLDN